MELDNNIISVIIPVYNGEKFVRKCIESVLNQENVDLEILVINDGSTDKTYDILKEFCNNEKVRIFNIKNSGVSNARNLGISKSKGKYIAFLDSDDTIPKNYYNKLLLSLKDNNADLAICGMRKIYTNKSEIIDMDMKYSKIDKKSFAKLFFELNENYLLMTVWNKLYRRSIIENIKFDNSIVMGEDYKFNLEVYEKCNTFIYVKECLYEYYQNFDSVTYVLDKRYSETYELKHSICYRNFLKMKFESIGIPNRLVEEYFINRVASWFIKVTENLFLIGNQYKYSERISKIKEILNDSESKKYVEKCDGKVIKNKIIKLLYKLKSANIVYVVFKIKVILKK